MNRIHGVKRMMLVLAGMLVALTVSAGADFYVDELGYDHYSIEGDHVVMLADGNKYTGKHLAIPASVVYQGETYTVKYVKGLAFQGNTSIESVELADGVDLWTGAFEDMESLKSIQLPKTLSGIPKEAFKNCHSLERVVIPEGVTSIAMQAFRDCSSLKSVIIPRTLTRFYSDQAFAGCTSLEEIRFPSVFAGGIYSDGEFSKYMSPPGSLSRTFNGCTNLKTVSFGSGNGSGSCPNISYAFNDCPSLQNLVLLYESPNASGISLPEEMLGKVTLYVPDVSVDTYRQSDWGGQFVGIMPYTELAKAGITEEFGEGQFYTFTPDDYTLTITCDGPVPGQKSYSSTNAYRDAGTTFAPWECFKSVIQHVVIEQGATGIETSSFKDCSNMVSLSLPVGLTRIDATAFQNCKSLTELTIPASVTTIEAGAFLGCYGLSSIKVESGNPNYDSRQGCNALIETSTGMMLIGSSSTVIPDGVKTIASYSFFNTDITKADLPNSVTDIGENAFRDCRKLTSVTIPKSVSEIRKQAFLGCSGLAELTIEDGVAAIGEEAFRDCSSLKELKVPGSVKKIGDMAFKACSSLKKLMIENGVESIGYGVFSNCTGLTSADLPNSVTNAGCPFMGCSSLTDLRLSEGLTILVSDFFANCSSLPTVTIPKSVTQLNGALFKGCTSLASITCLNPLPPTCNSSTFDGIDFTIPLYVPKGCVLKYKAADGWRNFVIIREASEDESHDIWLTVNDGAHGSLRLKIDEERPYVTLQFVADEGWHVYSVLLGEEDVTAELSADGTYTTPAINADSKLTVVYAEGDNGLNGLRGLDSQPEVKVSGGRLMISSLAAGDRLEVYTLDGHRVYSGRATNSRTEIPVTPNQVYIVRINALTLKLRS